MEKLESEFTHMISEHKKTVYTVCYMFSNNEDEVQDLFQESLINLWKGFGKFKGESNIKTWIWRVTLNSCISAERKKKGKNNVPLTMNVNFFEDTDRESVQVRMLHDRINKLQPFDRAIVLLWLENISYDEIAAIVGISTKNVSTRLFRIREQLKNMSNQ